MIKALFCIFSLSAFASCSTIKRALKSSKLTVDSTSTGVVLTASRLLIDSTSFSKDKTKTTNVSDSTYVRRTTIREYYSDEFDLEGNDSAALKVLYPSSPNQGRLLYKETEIDERGEVNRNVGQSQVSEAKTTLKQSDSSYFKNSKSISLKKVDSTKEKIVHRKNVIPWWLWLIGASLAFLLVLKYFFKL